MNIMNDERNQQGWKPDVLGAPFEMRHIEFESDYAGPARCTAVRLPLDGAHCGVLYVHGFSDYFFHAETAREFVSKGYAFYAVDLRRYGRSLQPGDEMFRVRDLREYFSDINATIGLMKADGIRRIILLGHSTGGLTAALYMAGRPDSAVKALILNSPFLTWNMPAAARRIGIPLIKRLHRIMPGLRIAADKSDRYARTLARHLEGEWEYNTDWKPDVLPPVSPEWIRAIDNALRSLSHAHISVPVLLLHSDRSASAKDGADMNRRADAVLDVSTMVPAGRMLGPRVTDVTIAGGLHDLALSAAPVRRAYYDAIFNWLADIF